MRQRQGIIAMAILLAGLGAGTATVRAEVVEEVVAWVNGDIITRSQLEEEEQAMMAEIYRRYAGEELDSQVKELRDSLLIRLIERRILVQKAKMLYDIDKMGEVFYEGFLEQQGITDPEQIQAALDREGLTVEGLKERLIDMFAPDEVLRFEVGSRISVGDKEVDAFYAENQAQFAVPAEVTLREIVLMAEDEAARTARRGEAEAIHARAVAAEDFGALAKEVSEAGTKETGGLLGPLKRGELAEQLDALAFGAPVGQVSELMETSYGFHIVRVETRTEDGFKPLEEVREQLRGWLEDRKYYSELKEFMEQARAESDWCVKEKFADRLPPDVPNPTCQLFNRAP